MNWNELYDHALQIAIQAHREQKDKSGREYIMHPTQMKMWLGFRNTFVPGNI